MSENNPIVVESVANVDFSINASNPRVDRFGYNPATPGVIVNARETGIPTEKIPFGVPIHFNTFQIKVENCTMDEKAAKEIDFEVTAKAASDEVARTLKDKGYREFWAGMMHTKTITKYWDYCHPKLSEIGIVCDFNEEDDFQAREYCPSCFYDWLTGNADCTQSWDERVGAGVKKEHIKRSLADELRKILIEANQEYLKSSQNEWRDLVGDYLSPEGKTKSIAPAQHFMRKNIHVLRPQDRELHRTAVLGESMAEALKSAIPPQSNLTPQDIVGIVTATMKAMNEQEKPVTAPKTENKQGETK